MLMKQPASADTTARSILEDRFLVPLLVLLALLSSTLFLAGTARAASASATSPRIPFTGYCSHPNGNGHCYATRYWLGGTGGANTLINPYGALRCYGCSGFIDDEMWFTDSSGLYWVEAGVSTWPTSNPNSCNQSADSTCLFWADSRPPSGQFTQHAMYNFGTDGVSLFPYLIYITISNNNGYSSSGSTWNISTNIYQNNNWIAGPSGQSRNNSMNVNSIMIGSELSDSQGSADNFYLQYNQWMGSNGNWNYQTTTGSSQYSTDPPPYGSWNVNPCDPNRDPGCSSNTGGSFLTND